LYENWHFFGFKMLKNKELQGGGGALPQRNPHQGAAPAPNFPRSIMLDPPLKYNWLNIHKLKARELLFFILFVYFFQDLKKKKKKEKKNLMTILASEIWVAENTHYFMVVATTSYISVSVNS